MRKLRNYLGSYVFRTTVALLRIAQVVVVMISVFSFGGNVLVCVVIEQKHW